MSVATTMTVPTGWTTQVFVLWLDADGCPHIAPRVED